MIMIQLPFFYVNLFFFLLFQVVKRSRYFVSGQTSEVDVPKEDYGKPSVELFGKWQLEPLQLPHAVNGIVPKVIVYFTFY